MTIALIGCHSNGTPKILDASQEEAAAVDKVLDFYYGECHQSIGFDTKNGKKETYFQLTMKKSEMLEQYSDLLEMPASNIAYIFYSNLDKDKNEYTHIRVRIELEGGETYEGKYPVDQLALIERYIPVLGQVTTTMIEKDYAGLLQLFDDDVAKSLSAEQLNEYCSKYDTALGNPTMSQLQGFSYFQDEKSGKPLVHIAGVLGREKDSSPITLFLNAANGKVRTLKFEY